MSEIEYDYYFKCMICGYEESRGKIFWEETPGIDKLYTHGICSGKCEKIFEDIAGDDTIDDIVK
jgi:hypothetical protein